MTNISKHSSSDASTSQAHNNVFLKMLFRKRVKNKMRFE